MTARQNWLAACATLDLATADVSDEALGGDCADAERSYYCDAKSAAVAAFFRTPAPDVAALARKLEFFLADDAHEHTDARDLLASMLDDARGLAARGGQG